MTSTRKIRTQQFRDKVNTDYFITLLDFVNKNKESENINDILSHYTNLKLECPTTTKINQKSTKKQQKSTN